MANSPAPDRLIGEFALFRCASAAVSQVVLFNKPVLVAGERGIGKRVRRRWHFVPGRTCEHVRVRVEKAVARLPEEIRGTGA